MPLIHIPAAISRLIDWGEVEEKVLSISIANPKVIAFQNGDYPLVYNLHFIHMKVSPSLMTPSPFFIPFLDLIKNIP